MYNVQRPRSCFYNSLISGTVGSGATLFGALLSSSSLNATENARQNIVSMPGTFKSFYAQTGSTQSGTGSLVLTARKNNADTSVVITIAAGSAAGTFSDLTNSFSAAAGSDVLGVKVVNNASATSAQIIGTGIYYFQ